MHDDIWIKLNVMFSEMEIKKAAYMDAIRITSSQERSGKMFFYTIRIMQGAQLVIF
jgi:hypothetical protein